MTLIKNLINIQGGKTAPPYTNRKCQLLLYRAIISLLEQPYSPVSLPLSFLIHLLNTGHNSKDTEIAVICENGLNKLELMCQPICSTFYVGRERVVSEENLQEEEKENSVIEEVVKENEVEKIHIISDIVIRPPENGEIVYEEATNIIESEVVVDVEEKSVNGSGDVCVIEEDSTDEEDNGATVKNLPIQQNGGDTENEVIEIFDEPPPTKKIKTDFDENSNDSMVNSFVNIVNDY